MGSSEDFEQEMEGRVPWDARGVVRVVFFSARARGEGAVCCVALIRTLCMTSGRRLACDGREGGRRF